jgi:DNA-binding IclR family transcriptional regulator
MLAHRPWPDVQSLIERYGWRPYTRQSIQDLERLQAELASARERGYALDREERRREVACVAAPIRDYSGAVIAALSASGQLSRFEPPHLEPLILRIVNTANRISLRLGYHGDEIFP